MRNILTALVIFLIGSVAVHYMFPFAVSPDIIQEEEFVKKVMPQEKHELFSSLSRYSRKTAGFLNGFSEADLTGFRCGDKLIRTDQGVYIYENIKTDINSKKRVRNPSFIEYMRGKEKTIPTGKKILTAKVCEMENRTVLLFYTIGSYDIGTADNTPIYQTIFNSEDNEAILEIFPYGTFVGAKSYALKESSGHVTCGNPIEIDRGRTLYVLCSEEKEKSSNHYVVGVDLNTGELTEVGKCAYVFPETQGQDCE